MREQIKAAELGGTPPFLSVVRRCRSDGYSCVWIVGRNPYFATQDGASIPCHVSFGVPYVDIEDPRCRPRPATAPGKGRYVKVVGRDGKEGMRKVIIGTIGIHRE